MKSTFFFSFLVFVLFIFLVDSQSEKRIIGGFETSIYRFPHHAAILVWKGWSSFWQVHCGGTIIDDRWILTAAHCFIEDKNNPEVTPCDSVKVAVGHEWSHFFWSWFKEYFVYVDKVITHPKYAKSVQDDIGLLRLTKKLKFCDKIQRVYLPHFNKVQYGQDVYVTGFGLTEKGGERSYQLKAAALQVAEEWNCARLYSNTPYTEERIICLISKDKSAVPCHIDSGGGVVRQLLDGSYEIVGVHVWSKCVPSYGSAAVRVNFQLPWILDQTMD